MNYEKTYNKDHPIIMNMVISKKEMLTSTLRAFINILLR